MKKTFLVEYEEGRKNYGGFAPDVPRCISLGDTLDEIKADLAEPFQFYMETVVELGSPIPVPTNSTVTAPIEGETDPKVTYVFEHLTVNIPKPRLSIVKRVITKRRTLQAA